MSFTATLNISATSEDVLSILVDIPTLARWNPAFGTISGAESRAIIGKEYHTRIRSIVAATMVFEKIENGRVEYQIDALGSSEFGTWAWAESTPNRTTVSHSFEHDGFLINLISRAFEQAPSWRIARLGSEALRRREKTMARPE